MYWRPPHLKKGYDYVAQEVGVETAERLCESNPRVAVDGAPWPQQPEMVGLRERVPLKFQAKKFSGPSRKSAFDDLGGVAPDVRKSGFFKRLFGR
jgi:hypothetical protein